MASPAPSRTIAATPHIICEFRSMIPQTNPKATYLEQKLAIDAAIQRVLDSGWYVGGEEVAAFEAEFAAWSGSRHAVAVASGTDALIVALRGLGIGPGAAVLTVSHTAVATVATIPQPGATPVPSGNASGWERVRQNGCNRGG